MASTWSCGKPGLTEDDLPTSLPELYDFAANWVWDYGEDHPEISLFDLGSYSSQLLYSLLLNDYIAYMQKQGGELVFDTPVFRRLMEGFSAIDFEEILSVQDQDEDTYWTPNALFSTSMSVGYLGYQDELPSSRSYLSRGGGGRAVHRHEPERHDHQPPHQAHGSGAALCERISG